MNKTNKYILIQKVIKVMVMMVIISSCNTYYFLNQKRLECYWVKEEKFEISKLHVESLDGKGYPKDFRKEITYVCLTTKEINNLQENEKSKEEVKFKPKRKIYFRKNNKYYKWCKMPCNSSKIKSTLEMKFDTNTWYELTGFPKNRFEGENYYIYFFIDEKGKMKTYHVFKK